MSSPSSPPHSPTEVEHVGLWILAFAVAEVLFACSLFQAFIACKRRYHQREYVLHNPGNARSHLTGAITGAVGGGYG